MREGLPEGWYSTPISAVTTVNPRHPRDLADELEVSFVPMVCVSESGPDLNGIRARTMVEVRTGFTHFAEGDVLFAKITPCMENGKGAVARGLTNSLGCGTTELHVLRPSAAIDAYYLYHFTHQQSFRKAGEAKFTGSAGQARVPVAFFDEAEIPLPPLPEQRRIVAKLEALLAKVDTSRKRLERIPVILKRFRQAILAAACEGRLTEDWRFVHPDGSASFELDRILSTRLESTASSIARERLKGFHRENQTLPGRENVLPETWIACCVGHVGNVVNGSTPSRKCPDYWAGDIPWVSSGEVQNGTIATTRESITREGFENASVSLLPRGTVLIAMIGEGKTRCQTALLDVDACINQNVAGVVMDHGLVDSRFLWYWFKARYEQNRTVGSGSGPQALNCQRVRELPLNLPPLEEQREITRRMDQMMVLADQIEARYIKAKTHVDRLSQSILAKAFRGELVPQDPNDEPAEMLLARLKAQPTDATSPKRRGRPKKAEG